MPRLLCLVLVLAALGGCQATPPAATAVTPKPGPDTPHETLRLRPVLVDPATGMPETASSISPSTPVDDPIEAARLRQAKGIADDPAAVTTAFQSIDCHRPDPLKGKDDPTLPLATCNSGGAMWALGPAVIDSDQIAAASYLKDNDGWVVNLSFTPAGRRAWADYTGAHVGGSVAMVVNGQVQSTPSINGRIDGDTELGAGFTEQQAHDLAAAINNH